jgi:hypothetical protein
MIRHAWPSTYLGTLRTWAEGCNEVHASCASRKPRLSPFAFRLNTGRILGDTEIAVTLVG